MTFPNLGPFSCSHSASPTPNSRSGVRPGIGVSRSEVAFKDDGAGGAPDCVAGVSAVPRGSGANTGNHSHVHFSAREPSPPNGDGGLDANSHGRGPGQSGTPTTPCASTHFTLFHLNPQGRRCPPENLALVDALLQSLDLPDFVAFTETWLDRGTEHCELSGYHLVSRLDRRNAIRSDRGGIAFYVRDGLQASVVHIGDSEVDERSWHVIHANAGPILVCVWYRRPDGGEIASILRFQHEYEAYSQHAVSFLAVGDFNIHNRA